MVRKSHVLAVVLMVIIIIGLYSYPAERNTVDSSCQGQPGMMGSTRPISRENLEVQSAPWVDHYGQEHDEGERLVLVNPDDLSETELAVVYSGRIIWPYWSPDGRYVAFLHTLIYNDRIVVVEAREEHGIVFDKVLDIRSATTFGHTDDGTLWYLGNPVELNSGPQIYGFTNGDEGAFPVIDLGLPPGTEGLSGVFARSNVVWLTTYLGAVDFAKVFNTDGDILFDITDESGVASVVDAVKDDSGLWVVAWVVLNDNLDAYYVQIYHDGTLCYTYERATNVVK